MTNFQKLGGVAALPAPLAIRAWTPGDLPLITDLSVAEGWLSLRDRPDAGLAAWRNSQPALVATADQDVVGRKPGLDQVGEDLLVLALGVGTAASQQRATAHHEDCRFLEHGRCPS